VHASAPPGAAIATATASTVVSRPAATPQQRAVADAAAILAAFAVPPGARRLADAPDVAGGVLKEPPVLSATPDLVDDASWWQAPGSPQAVLGWEQAHLPRRFSATGNGEIFGPGRPTAWSDSFSLAAVPGVLNSRQLIVEAVSSENGQTMLRVDAQVTWLPAKSATERVPSTARVVTITPIPGLDSRGRPPTPATLNDATAVRRIASLVNAMPVLLPGSYSCPMDTGQGLRLTFRAAPGGPAVATTTIGLDGCGDPELAAQVLAIAGLHWPGYTTHD
jgi:hypothetical protein